MRNEKRIQFIKDMDLVQQISARWSALVDTSDLTREAVWLSEWAHRPADFPEFKPISRDLEQIDFLTEDEIEYIKSQQKGTVSYVDQH